MYYTSCSRRSALSAKKIVPSGDTARILSCRRRWGKVSQVRDAIHLVEALLHPQPEFRISAEDTLAMNWLAVTDDAQVNDLGSTQDALQGLQLSSPALDMSTPSKTGPVSLHSMSSNISLATTVTLVNEPELPPRLRAPPSSSPRRATGPGQYRCTQLTSSTSFQDLSRPSRRLYLPGWNIDGTHHSHLHYPNDLWSKAQSVHFRLNQTETLR